MFPRLLTATIILAELNYLYYASVLMCRAKDRLRRTRQSCKTGGGGGGGGGVFVVVVVVTVVVIVNGGGGDGDGEKDMNCVQKNHPFPSSHPPSFLPSLPPPHHKVVKLSRLIKSGAT